MPKYRAKLAPCVAALIVAAIAACSSSTSPKSSGSTGLTSPSGATKGDSIDLTGTYNLTHFTEDSSDGGSYSNGTDANDGGTLVLTSTNFTLTWTGAYETANGNGTSGTYVATDSSSTADRGTIVLTSNKSQTGTYTLSNDSLYVSLPNSSSGVTDITVWIKQ